MVIGGVLALVLAPLLAAQSPPMKWEKIELADLQMQDFPADTNAAAIILCEFGESILSVNGEVEHNVHRRIKILKEAGYDKATVVLPYYAKGRQQKIERVDGRTYKLGPDGEVIKLKLDKKAIFEEDINDEVKQIKFTLPGLAPGCIIEYRYRILSQNPIHLPDWSFQSDEPTRWSEYWAWVPRYFYYVSVTQGTSHFPQNEAREEKRYDATGTWKRWFAQDVPALRNEPFMTTVDDYRTKIRFQLAEVSFPGGYRDRFLHTWEELAKTLIDHGQFGNQANRKKLLPEPLRASLAAETDDVSKMVAVYDYLRTTMNWNGDRGLFVDTNVDKALERRSGSAPEIALLLVAMLRDAGLEATPAIMSTRSHGKIQPLYPMATQFNHTLAFVQANGTPYLLDATDRHRPYTMLPVQALNGSAFLLDKENPSWITIEPAEAYRRNLSAVVRIDSTGSLQGQLTTVEHGYSALEKRKSLETMEHVDFVQQILLDGIFDAVLDTFSFRNIDSVMAPLMTSAEFRSAGHIRAAGDFLYLDPMLLAKIEENPLKLETRYFPVDYAYKREITYRANFDLPDGYIIDDLPQNTSIQLPQKGGSYQLIYQRVGEKALQMYSRFSIDKTIFKPEEYDNLRRLYDLVVSTQRQPVVLRREPN